MTLLLLLHISHNSVTIILLCPGNVPTRYPFHNSFSIIRIICTLANFVNFSRNIYNHNNIRWYVIYIIYIWTEI